jgi:hypothetical protein
MAACVCAFWLGKLKTKNFLIANEIYFINEVSLFSILLYCVLANILKTAVGGNKPV